MHLIRQLRLSTKILLIELFTTLVVFVPLSALSYKKISESLTQSYEVALAKTVTSLNEGLQKPLWDFSPEDAESVLNNELANDYVDQINVSDAKGQHFVSKSKKVEVGASKTIDLLYRDRVIGKVEIWINSERLVKEKRSLIQLVLILNMMALILILGITAVMLRFSIVSRLKKLKTQSKMLVEGNLTVAFDWGSGDEIDDLGRSFEQARLQLSGLFKEIQDSHSNLETEVKYRSEQLVSSSKLALLGEMAGGIAHEINNPVTIIKMKASQLKKLISTRDVPKEQALEFLTTIESTSNRITQIVAGLRNFARNDEGESVQNYSYLQIVNDLTGLCAEKIKTNGVDLKFLGDPNIQFECSPVQLEQVLLNLINNAFDAVCGSSEPWIELECKKVGSQINFTVTDSGNGIPAEIVKKMMQPFFTTKPVGKGTGLGLSISFGIVRAHGGELRYENKHKNTRFLVTFPDKQSPTFRKVA